jgi:hypothetical protein
MKWLVIKGKVMQLLLLLVFFFSLEVMAVDSDFNQQYNGPTTVIQPQKLNTQKQSEHPAFNQHFYGPTTIIDKDNAVGKYQPTGDATVSPVPTLVNVSDQLILEEFVQRGIMQKIKAGYLFLPQSAEFLDLKLCLTPSSRTSTKKLTKKEKQKRH